MADTPTPAYSVRIRVRMENRPGMLGELAIAIGAVGANISALQGFEVVPLLAGQVALASKVFTVSWPQPGP